MTGTAARIPLLILGCGAAVLALNMGVRQTFGLFLEPMTLDLGISRGNFALAISGFEEYASRYVDSDLADNALYWVGECLLSQGDYAGAIKAYDRMLSQYPRSDRAAAAHLKKGLCFLEQNDIGQAIVQLEFVREQFTGSDEARIARDKLASLGESG